ncbi:MAG TPA: hypothetical protein VLG09_00230 [Candidatus Saccharimonadales bacterium]|nr:hypothetical protein [Candidatus Saccharimonadales bacterium]
MKQKAKDKIKLKVANTFGVLGYLFCLLQWLWATILYLSVIQMAATITAPDATQHVTQYPTPTVTLPSQLLWVIVGITTFIMIVVTIYAFIKVPVGAVKASSKAIHRTAVTMTPVAISVQHKKDTKTLRMKITPQLTLIIKLLLSIIPVGLTLASLLLKEQQASYNVAIAVGAGLGLLAIVSFSIQYILLRLFRLKANELL